MKPIPPININVCKASVNGQVYDVLSYDEYAQNFENNKSRSDIGIRKEVDGVTYVIPYKGKYTNNATEPGVYNAGCVDFIKMPKNSEKENYVPERIYSLSNQSDLSDIINSGKLARALDEPFITAADNITHIEVKPNDQPEMKALKMAINAKHIDLDKYAIRFGDNYPNDKRQLKGSGATLNIIKRYCDNCDMEAVLTLRDKHPNVANPIGHEISVSLTQPDQSSEFESED